LTHVARSLAAGNLAQRVVVAGDDEMALLGQTFNRMVDSLQKAEESRRAMIADIAHELRTPLAVQQANLEALQDGIYPLTAENLVPLLEQNQLLIRLVEDLRVLALADTGQLTLESTEIDLGALLQSVAARFYPKASINQATIETLIQPDCPPIKLDPARIEQILTNLLSNALRHTPAQGKIEINMAHSATQAVVTVRDTGAGIPPEALPHIFERFYRAEKSRSRIAGGSGLGLSIARQLAQLHGGDLTAANHPQGGAVFTLTLPISNDKK
jgi:two-component system OmpR family sensor kinase/two-component system sensor histidine kinase BaeS